MFGHVLVLGAFSAFGACRPRQQRCAEQERPPAGVRGWRKQATVGASIWS